MSSHARSIVLPYNAGDGTVFTEEEWHKIGQITALASEKLTERNWRNYPEIARETEIIFGSWGLPTMDEEFLEAFPRLRAVFYAAGSIRGFVTEAFWRRGILVSSAFAANAVPVAEFTFAQVVLAAKHAWPLAMAARRNRTFPGRSAGMPGTFRTTVGLISLGMIGRLVAERLRSLDMKVLAYDPFFPPDAASSLGVELVPLDRVFSESDVVSCHAPWIPETEGLIQERHFRAMRRGATFINTARGAVVDEPGMIRVLRDREDLTALLDVTWPEPPAPESPLYDLPNIFITPHIAGSMEGECRRMAHYMIDECRRYLAGEPLRYAISEEQSRQMA